MKYKILLLIICLSLLTGCTSKEDVLTCNIGSTTITITVKNGKIVKYNDKINGDISNEEIDTLNKSYLEDIDNNKDAITKLREVIASNTGDCN